MNKSSKPFLVVAVVFFIAIAFELVYSNASLSYLTNPDYDGSSVTSSATNSSDNKSSGILLVITGIAVVALVACVVAHKSNKKTSDNEMKLDKSRELDEKTFKAFVPNKTKEEFLTDRVNDLIEIQNGRMNIDYNILKTKVSEELFNEYNKELTNLQNNNEKNIMKDFKVLDSMVTGADVVNGQYEIKVEVIMQYIDYIIKDGVRISGDEYLPNTKLYELVFTTSLRTTVDNCPNCGASLIDKSSKICPSCNGTIVKNNKWLLSKKIAKVRK